MKAQRASLKEKLKAVYAKLHSIPIVSEDFNQTPKTNYTETLKRTWQNCQESFLFVGSTVPGDGRPAVGRELSR